MWRPDSADYASFAEHLEHCETIPTLLPWPLSPGWVVADFGCVVQPGEQAQAGFASCTGLSDLDGVVELTVVSEEPGVGLGARCAGVVRTDPGGDVGEGPPHVKLRVNGRPISAWAISTADSSAVFDRSVFAGEALGRWLWLVLRPASAALLLSEDWDLVDVSGFGPELVEIPFGGGPPPC